MKVKGLKIWKNKCPKCGGIMFIKACPCMYRKKGWKICARCFNTKCRKVIKIK